MSGGLKFVKPTELDFALKRDGFEIAESCGVALNPLTMRWGINTDLSTNYLQFHRMRR
jgi:2-polyprenyl-6-hydroxyphenyl methylase / 3-demethylubiquinone-9 3-methyltransferase